MPPTASLPAPRIRILSDAVKSRIAAGEVVERPASVLKELVENALDAGARQVEVELAEGGRTLLRVADDGAGMTREELALAVRRHATSKLAAAEDLEALATLGFRGEALPSIGSVARMTLVSRPRPVPVPGASGEDAGEAWRLTVDGGLAGELQPAARDFGTSVEVRDLFYCHPARLKFMRSPAAEAAACAETLLRVALTRPHTAFRLMQGRQELLGAPAVQGAGLDAYAARARQLLGSAAAEWMPFCAQGPGEAGTLDTGAGGLAGAPGYALFGLVAPPDRARPNRSQIYLAVNGRPVRDRTLTTAFTEAFRHLLAPRRFPAGVVFLACPGGEVDINVHPAKAEVRFRRASLVFSLFHHAVREAFAPRAPQRAAPPAPAPAPAPLGSLWSREGPPPTSPASSSPAPQAPEVQRPSLAAETFPVFAASSPPEPVPSPAAPRPAVADPPPFRILGQAGGAFIVLEDATGVKLIDQHALHERVLFEDLLRRAERGSGSSQGLLVPEPVELTPAQTAAFGSPEARDVLEELGFALEEFGPRTVAVSAVPACLASPRAPQLVAEILEAFASEDPRRASRAALREKAVTIASCKGAIKAGERLTGNQMETLVREFHARIGALAYTCPHGRPLAVDLSWAELERRVGRK